MGNAVFMCMNASSGFNHSSCLRIVKRSLKLELYVVSAHDADVVFYSEHLPSTA